MVGNTCVAKISPFGGETDDKGGATNPTHNRRQKGQKESKNQMKEVSNDNREKKKKK